jgi:hypothetical protein
MNYQIAELAQQFITALHDVETAQEDSDVQDALDNMVSLFSDDARLTNTQLSKAGRELTGHIAIRGFWSDYRTAVAPGHSEFHQITTSDRAAGLFWITEGQGAEGQPIHYHGATLLQFSDDGLILFFRGYYDVGELSASR